MSLSRPDPLSAQPDTDIANVASLRTNFQIIDSLVTYSIKANGTQFELPTNKESNFSGELYLITRLAPVIDSIAHSSTAMGRGGKNTYELKWANTPIAYTYDSEEENLIRRFDISYNIIEKDSSGNIISVQPIITQPYLDTVPVDTYQYISQSEWEFTTQPLPPAQPNLWDSVLEPVVVIGSAILSVYLLFSIRSS